jgi:hypothetical protein
VPEESVNPPNPDEALRRLERRIEYLEHTLQHENKWWRGGLIAALVLIALSILIAGHHRHHRHPGPMGMQGCGGQRMMPYGPPPPPPNWGYGPGGGYYGPPQQGWRYHQWNGPGSDGPPSPPKG